MTPTRYDLRAWGRLIKTILKNFPNIYTYLGTNLRYIPVVISKSAHPNLQYDQDGSEYENSHPNTLRTGTSHSDIWSIPF
jgi:hypothetical protein